MTRETGDDGVIKKFDTGATRSSEAGKLDYEGFLSPLVLRRYAEYLNEHRVQADGTLRDSDNWQKGIPKKNYVKSLIRHFMDLWLAHRGGQFLGGRKFLQDALCAIIFNAMGYLFEDLQEEGRSPSVHDLGRAYCQENYENKREAR